MDIQEKAIDLELSAQAELEEMKRERDANFSELEVLSGDPLVLNFEKMALDSDGVKEELVREYRNKILKIQDLTEAISILDRAIVLLDMDVDVNEAIELETDMEFPIYE